MDELENLKNQWGKQKGQIPKTEQDSQSLVAAASRQKRELLTGHIITVASIEHNNNYTHTLFHRSSAFSRTAEQGGHRFYVWRSVIKDNY